MNGLLKYRAVLCAVGVISMLGLPLAKAQPPKGPERRVPQRVVSGSATVTLRVVTLPTPSATDVAATLPASETVVLEGQTFYAEVWSQTIETGGLSGVHLDLTFDPLVFSAVSVTNTTAFGLLANSGTIDNVAGWINDFGGNHLDPGCAGGFGVKPTWIRVASVEFSANASAQDSPIESLDAASPIYGIVLCGISGMIDPGVVDFGMASMEVRTPCGGDPDCDDALFCNGSEACVGGACQPGLPPVCDDGDVCTVDACDEQFDACVNTNDATIAVAIEIDSLQQAVVRDVRFVLTDCGGRTEIVTMPVAFDATGFGSVVLEGVDAHADYVQATEGHTLGRALPIVFDGPQGCSAELQFTGEARLISGDLSNAYVPQDGLVDVQDFAILAIEWEHSVDPNLGMLADVTGDGMQDASDLTVLLEHVVATGESTDGCAASVLALAGTKPRNELAIRSFRGPHSDLMPIDLDENGLIDARDIRIFVNNHNIALTRKAEDALGRMERRETREAVVPTERGS